MLKNIVKIKSGKNIPVEFEKDPDILLTKEEIIQCCKETKEIVEKWFDGKDDDWLKLPYNIIQ
ncbi:MAG: hypothetical protein LBK25_02050 [Treponema sp.]|nr:hypothetical protein [Treponema sp.]